MFWEKINTQEGVNQLVISIVQEGGNSDMNY